MWLRPGVVHASCGAVDILRSLVARLRAAWPGVQILLRADNGLGVPAVYDFCESDGLEYVIGYATNAVLERATAQALADVELYYRFYGRRDPHVQRFEEVRDYQAGGWPHAPGGGQGRAQSARQPTALCGDQPDRGRCGSVPGDLCAAGRGTRATDRRDEERLALRAAVVQRFLRKAFRLLIHALAYAIVVLFREAAADVPEVATASVATLRQRLWKVAAVVVTSPRRVFVQVSSVWPYRDVWQRVQEAVTRYVARWRGDAAAVAVPVG